MSELRVKKEALSAILYLADGETLFGTLYLAPFSPAHSGSQTVEDLMAEAGSALPITSTEGSFLLVGKRAIAAIDVPLGTHRPAGFWSTVAVRVRLTGRHEIEGNLLVERGTGTRLSDFLNAPPSWLVVETGDTLVWIAKDHLVAMEAVES